MLSGLLGMGDAMFSHLGGVTRSDLLPDPKEMSDAADQAQFVRKSDVRAVCVRTYDLSKEEDEVQYCKDREWLFMGLPMKTHALIHHEKKFVAELNPPRWFAHMEWVEFELTQTAVPTIEQQARSHA